MAEREPSFTRGRKWRIGFNVVIAAVSAFALVVMANYLAARHSLRYNWSDAAANKLSPLTVRTLNGLTNNVKVIVYFDRDEPLFGLVSSLIKDYQLRSPRLEVEFVDYRYPGRAAMVRAQYKLTAGSEGSRVIFDSNGRVRSVLSSELSDFAMQGKEFRRTAFKGEQLFTAALLNVTTARRSKAYFLSGHGEHSPESEDDNIGYARFAKMLADNDVEWSVFSSLHSQELPEDCSLLIIAGPGEKFLTEELERLQKYLSKGGRLLAFFPFVDRKVTGLENLLAAWNVDVGRNAVQDRARSKSNDSQVIAQQFGSHPVTRSLLRSSLNFVLPRSVSSRAIGATRADAPKTTELVFTGPEGIAIGSIDEKGMGQVERRGAIPLAVAVEKGGIQGVAADAGATRIVAVGSSVSFANAVIQDVANADFANLAVNWLLNRDHMLSEIPPRAITNYTISVTEEQMRVLRWILLGAAPVGALAIGGIVWLRRRS